MTDSIEAKIEESGAQLYIEHQLLDDLSVSLPVVVLNEGLSIQLFDLLGLIDVKDIEKMAKELARRIEEAAPGVDLVVVAEAKAIPLAVFVAKELGCNFITLRKSAKDYMKNPVGTPVQSITTKEPQTLYLDQRHAWEQGLGVANVVLLDDVVSTGGTLEAMETAVTKAGGAVVAEAAVFTEGTEEDKEKWASKGVISLGHLVLNPEKQATS